MPGSLCMGLKFNLNFNDMTALAALTLLIMFMKSKGTTIVDVVYSNVFIVHLEKSSE